MVFEELRCQVDNINSNLSIFIFICKELERKYEHTRQKILEGTVIMPNDQHLQNYLNNLMRVSGHPDPKVADAADHLSHKTPSLKDQRHHHDVHYVSQEVEMGVVQAIPKVVHSTGQATKRDNEDKGQDMGRIRVPDSEKTHEDETNQGVMTGNDIESPFDRIEESCQHQIDCIQQPHFDDIHEASQSHEARPSQTKAGSSVKRHGHKNSVSKTEQWNVDDISKNNCRKFDKFLRGFIYYNTLCDQSSLVGVENPSRNNVEEIVTWLKLNKTLQSSYITSLLSTTLNFGYYLDILCCLVKTNQGKLIRWKSFCNDLGISDCKIRKYRALGRIANQYKKFHLLQISFNLLYKYIKLINKMLTFKDIEMFWSEQ
jgi:hypothetical protein